MFDFAELFGNGGNHRKDSQEELMKVLCYLAGLNFAQPNSSRFPIYFRTDFEESPNYAAYDAEKDLVLEKTYAELVALAKKYYGDKNAFSATELLANVDVAKAAIYAHHGVEIPKEKTPEERITELEEIRKELTEQPMMSIMDRQKLAYIEAALEDEREKLKPSNLN